MFRVQFTFKLLSTVRNYLDRFFFVYQSERVKSAYTRNTYRIQQCKTNILVLAASPLESKTKRKRAYQTRLNTLQQLNDHSMLSSKTFVEYFKPSSERRKRSEFFRTINGYYGIFSHHSFARVLKLFSSPVKRISAYADTITDIFLPVSSALVAFTLNTRLTIEKHFFCYQLWGFTS